MNDPFNRVIVFIGALICVTAPFLILCVNKRMEHDKMLADHKCVVYSKEMTGNKVVFGKGQTRDEIRTLYKCDDGPRVEVE